MNNSRHLRNINKPTHFWTPFSSSCQKAPATHTHHRQCVHPYGGQHGLWAHCLLVHLSCGQVGTCCSPQPATHSWESLPECTDTGTHLQDARSTRWGDCSAGPQQNSWFCSCPHHTRWMAAAKVPLRYCLLHLPPQAPHSCPHREICHSGSCCRLLPMCQRWAPCTPRLCHGLLNCCQLGPWISWPSFGSLRGFIFFRKKMVGVRVPNSLHIFCCSCPYSVLKLPN